MGAGSYYFISGPAPNFFMAKDKLKRAKNWLCLSLSFLILFSCQKKERLPFGKEDSLSVFNQLKIWRDTLKHYQFLEFNEKPLILSVGLFPQDTVYQGRSEIEKIAHLLSFWRTTQDTLHLDSLTFLIDSLNQGDTFCFVLYNDSTRHTIALFKYDSLWLIRFRDSVSLETVAKISYPLPQEKEKIYPLIGKRRILFRKEAGDYLLKKLSGFSFSHPKDTAPVIKSISLTQEGRSINLENTEFGKLIPVDSLPCFRANEEIVVTISCEKPGDTSNLKYFGFLSKRGERVFLGEGYDLIGGINFPQLGIQHIFIEIIPSQNLFYPNSPYSYTILCLPLRITQ